MNYGLIGNGGYGIERLNKAGKIEHSNMWEIKYAKGSGGA